MAGASEVIASSSPFNYNCGSNLGRPHRRYRRTADSSAADSAFVLEAFFVAK